MGFASYTTPGLYSLRRHRLVTVGIPIINLRQSPDHVRFTMAIPTPVRRRRTGVGQTQAVILWHCRLYNIDETNFCISDK